jgi:hypothetical protein
MERDRSQLVQRDLFLAPIIRDTSCPLPPKRVPAQRPRHFLPKDLPNAIKHLSDGELDRLLAVSIDEAKRRGRLPLTLQANPRTNSKRSSTEKRQGTDATVTLTRGQMNAVFAAFKAGIKPSQIARQFGIARSDVQKVLTEWDT